MRTFLVALRAPSDAVQICANLLSVGLLCSSEREAAKSATPLRTQQKIFLYLARSRAAQLLLLVCRQKLFVLAACKTLAIDFQAPRPQFCL